MRSLVAAQRAALREVLGAKHATAAWRACTEMCGGAARGTQVEEALSAALELAATAGERLAAKPLSYTAESVRHAVLADRRGDGHANYAYLRVEGKREWRRMDEMVPMSPLQPAGDEEDGQRREPVLEDYAQRPDEYPSEQPESVAHWEWVLEEAMRRDPVAVTAWQMRASRTGTRDVASALGQASPAQGSRLPARGWAVIQQVARGGGWLDIPAGQSTESR